MQISRIENNSSNSTKNISFKSVHRFNIHPSVLEAPITALPNVQWVIEHSTFIKLHNSIITSLRKWDAGARELREFVGTFDIAEKFLPNAYRKKQTLRAYLIKNEDLDDYNKLFGGIWNNIKHFMGTRKERRNIQGVFQPIVNAGEPKLAQQLIAAKGDEIYYTDIMQKKFLDKRNIDVTAAWIHAIDELGEYAKHFSK